MDTAHILIVDDDEDDCMLVRDAISASRPHSENTCLHSGEDLLDYLYHQNAHANSDLPTPDLILIDLNMSGMSGKEVLKKIKTDHGLKSIPVVVLTASDSEIDILMSYQFGANSFIKKPATFDGLIDAIKLLMEYWFELARVPSGKRISNRNFESVQ